MVELSAYEAKRQRRMAENRALLLALKIERLPSPKRQRRDVNTSSKRSQPVRRSLRLEQLMPVPQPETDGDGLSGEDRVVALPKTLVDVPEVELEYIPTRDRAITTQVDIQVAAFHDQWLGKRLTPIGKSPVLLAMVNAGAASDRKLNAACGQQRCVQEFGNALAVFVDMQQGENRKNVFQAAGHGVRRVVFFRWFPWDSWTRQRPAVERLQRVRLGDKRFLLKGAVRIDRQKKDQSHEQLLLFVQNSEKDPYVYCGRLALLGMRATQPLEFRWQLLDAHALSWMDASPQADESKARTPRTD